MIARGCGAGPENGDKSRPVAQGRGIDMIIDNERINAAGSLSSAVSGYGTSLPWPNVGERASHS